MPAFNISNLCLVCNLVKIAIKLQNKEKKKKNISLSPKSCPTLHRHGHLSQPWLERVRQAKLCPAYDYPFSK